MDYIKLQNLTPFDFMGLAIRDADLKSLTSASVALINVPPGVSHARSKSNKSDKLYICLCGNLVFTIDETQVEVEPFGLLVVSKGEWFEYGNQCDGTASMLLVHVPPFDLNSEESDT